MLKEREGRCVLGAVLLLQDTDVCFLQEQIGF